MKKEHTVIPSHYRKLASNEVIRNGDLFIKNGVVYEAYMSVGKKAYEFSHLTYYRRRHVKIKKSVPPVDTKAYPSKSPLVSFSYPNRNVVFTLNGDNPFPARSERHIRLIAADNKYLIGLDVNDNFKFKKFLRSKAGKVEVVEFNTNVLK